MYNHAIMPRTIGPLLILLPVLTFAEDRSTWQNLHPAESRRYGSTLAQVAGCRHRRLPDVDCRAGHGRFNHGETGGRDETGAISKRWMEPRENGGGRRPYWRRYRARRGCCRRGVQPPWIWPVFHARPDWRSPRGVWCRPRCRNRRADTSPADRCDLFHKVAAEQLGSISRDVIRPDIGSQEWPERRAIENHHITCPECTAILRRYWSVRARQGEIAQAKPNAAVVGV
jgi:hypothetical protein